MGGCCCRSARRTASHGPPVYYCCPEDLEENEPMSSTHDPPFAVPVIFVDPVLDASISDSGQEANALPPLEDFARTLSNTVTVGDADRDRLEDLDSCDGFKECERKSVYDFVSNSPKVKEKLSNLDNSIILIIDEEDVCPTCLEEYDAENPQIITKCKHHFHLSCILEWFERSNRCPICDKIMEVDDMAPFDQTL